MKSNYSAYYGIDKDMGVDESVDWNSTKTKADKYDNYICAELQLPDQDGIKWMTRVR